MTVTWSDDLKTRNVSINLRGAYISGGRSIAGTEQRVHSGAGYWSISVSVPIRRPDQALAWRAMMDRARAGEDILLKVCDLFRPAALISAPSAAVSGSAPMGATSITVITSGLGVLEAGHHFSAGQRLHRINRVIASQSVNSIWHNNDEGEPWSDTDIWWDDAYSGLMSHQVSFLPPLRAAAAGTSLAFRDLVVLCRPDDASTGDLDLDLGRFATPTLTLTESI